MAGCFDGLDPKEICSKLEILLNQRIIPGQTLLFFDEVQNCPRAITALRYFKEKLPALHVIAAGSLLEFVLHEEEFVFPVGRVEFMHLRPLSFREYLVSQGEERAIEFLDQVSLDKEIPSVIHEDMLRHVRQYFLIGGMPAVVDSYRQEHSFLECQRILGNLLETYRSDFMKYATKAQHKYLQLFFDKAPGLVAQHFKFSHIDPEVRARELRTALEQLGWAGLIHRVTVSNASGIPLQAHAKENKSKLLFLDIGLMNCANKADLQILWETHLRQLQAGAQAEQFVGQELLAYPALRQPQLYYWEREKPGALAEVDFVIQLGSHIIPIEVKAGTTGRLYSMAQFIRDKKSPLGIRISQQPLSFHSNILSVPFYLIEQIPRLVLAAGSGLTL